MPHASAVKSEKGNAFVKNARAAVVGGGAFGCRIAIALARSGVAVDLFEAERGLLLAASGNNHNRLHLGYHYLRSLETARQSISGFLSFMFEYGSAIYTNFDNFYAIASEGSKTSPAGFEKFCREVGIAFEEAWPNEQHLDQERISASYRVPEPLIDTGAFRKLLWRDLTAEGVQVFLNHRVSDVHMGSQFFHLSVNDGIYSRTYDYLVSATYADEQVLNSMLGVLSPPRRYEHVLIPEVFWPGDPIGLTVMDGPFCSVMPFAGHPGRALVYHVDASVVGGPWHQRPDPRIPIVSLDENVLREIVCKSSAFFPALDSVEISGARSALRSVTENTDDARLSDVNSFGECPGYLSIFSGKLTTCVTTADEGVRALLSDSSPLEMGKV